MRQLNVKEYLEKYHSQIMDWDGKEELTCIFYEDEWEYNGITLKITPMDYEGDVVVYEVCVFASSGDTMECGHMYSAYIFESDSVEGLKEQLMGKEACSKIEDTIRFLKNRIDMS